MPVFQETADEERDFRILPSIERPLPRLTPQPAKSEDKYEVVVIGAGPAGLTLTLLLARYGITSLACFDAKPGTLKAGQADGLQPRTLEVLKSLDVADEILNHGCHMSEVAFWNPIPASKSESNGKGNPGIERTSFVPDVVVPARYQHEVTIHQGRIERILEENLRLYTKNPVMNRSSRFVDFKLDAASDAEYPLSVVVETQAEGGDVSTRTIRAKHLVGADGAHSNVRRAMGLHLQGETTDHIWGVADFVADTDFPDIRKRSAIHSEAGSIMIIPRERISSGEFLTRLYVQVKDDEVPSEDTDPDDVTAKIKSAKRRAAITLEYIMEQANKVFAPYTVRQKEGTKVDWWAAYQIGQRMTSKFSLADEAGLERVFIVGDACHTHSPKAGQGMNVSMMDSYNLAWKLAHTIHGLAPKSSSKSNSIISTFEHERLNIAQQLINFDTQFSSMFSGQIGSDTMEGLTHEQFLKVFSDGSGFTSGCGIEYPAGVLVDTAASKEALITGDDYLMGVLKTGRRLLNTVVRRYADANIRNLHDDFPSNGRYRLLVFTSTTLTTPGSPSTVALDAISQKIIPSFPKDTIELVALHPFRKRSFEWADIPASVKKLAEMRFHGPAQEDTYGIYGVSEEKGAVVVVRPDGYVGCIAGLEDTERVGEFLKGCLVQV